jgi:hypothetical protein
MKIVALIAGTVCTLAFTGCTCPKASAFFGWCGELLK